MGKLNPRGRRFDAMESLNRTYGGGPLITLVAGCGFLLIGLLPLGVGRFFPFLALIGGGLILGSLIQAANRTPWLFVVVVVIPFFALLLWIIGFVILSATGIIKMH